ncbi:multidrug ABC transporter ATP-binding protein [Pontibacillus halophilus JSM 076056 = DSM 19796]|uniref:Multidrug ABC transporter ATP-binding protein n=1 Tax=Pontibacillus halophilus JSM 076056 = DSM 19796 TaxID=1385510 RepID=A0A0A5HXJ5_9BACI|nr:ABC-F family ATP-binding cassette domain-containing protein [Pontibacillus halophilus]KGX88342.1 multidrug ABC transporter ATP-binding protein [Pontibacillus halophilus JSM 076056 = DSM 19796]
MILMQVNQITKLYGADLILSNIKLEVHSNDRIAIVGRNGAGKSTLLKIMAGELPYDEGEIYKPKDVRIGYLQQHTGLESEDTIWNEMRTVFRDLIQMEQELRHLEEKMGDPAYLEDAEAYEKLLKEYDEKQLAFKNQGGYRYEADINAVLNGLQFKDFDRNTPIQTLSGGQKTRLALGKLLLSKPDVLILDEPTNHLDIETLNWLEGYLQGYDGSVVIVSHDRYFLDKVVNTVYEISRQASEKFVGNYTKYLEAKEANYERDMKRFEKHQAEVKRMEDFVQKNIARASTTKRAQSTRKKLEKMETVDKPNGAEKSAKFSFQIQRQTGNDVLKIRDASFRYSDAAQPIFRDVSFDVGRKDRIAIVGPNGVGKTTLLKNIIGKFQLTKGSIQIGSNVLMGYYDQEQTELRSSKTVLDELWDEYPLQNEKDIRTVLGNFLFSGDDVLKVVSSLSGGERARLALAKLMMEQSNVLILDEPTNHLDLDSKEVLESALADYPGTIIFVSHDRYFINRIATQVVEMQRDGATIYLGDYDYYVDKKEETAERERLEELERQQKNPTTTATTNDKQDYQQDKAEKREARKRQRRIEEIEQQIEEHEAKIEENDDLLCLPEVYQDHERSLELTQMNESLQTQIETLMEEWEDLQE